MFCIVLFQETSMLPIINLCDGLSWHGMHTRLKAYLNFFDSALDDDTIYYVTDGIDVFFNDMTSILTNFPSVDDYIISIYQLFDKPIVMSTERICGWGGANLCNNKK